MTGGGGSTAIAQSVTLNRAKGLSSGCKYDRRALVWFRKRGMETSATTACGFVAEDSIPRSERGVVRVTVLLTAATTHTHP